MRIAIHGATGRMGKELVRLVHESRERGDQIVGAIAAADAPEQGSDVGEVAGVGHLGVSVTSDHAVGLLGADIAIDFSSMSAITQLARAVKRAKVALVSGTTGIDASGAAALGDAAETIPVLWAANMSVGIEAVAQVVRTAVAALGDEYDVEILETHHRHKVDAPSGTALRLAEAVREARTDLALRHGREGTAGPRKKNELAVMALRGGDVIGDHTIYIMGPGERIEITHRATQRDLFARGALRAARWLIGKKPGRYSLRDLLGLTHVSMVASDDARRLTAELETALLRELRASYQDVNVAYFKRGLKAAEIKLSDNDKRLGQWRPERRCIEMSRPLLVSQPWGVVMEVLKHEMAHQYVHEILGRTDEPAHGPAFREVCERLGIDARAAGLPMAADGAGASDLRQESIKILERVSQLLALAQSTNVHEAQAATSLAQKLMLKYNLDSAALGARHGYYFRHLGKPSGRITESERLLSVLLGEHFFVEVIWVPVYRPFENKRGQVLEICGTSPNLEMASYVHAFLTHSAERLWVEHKRARGIDGNRDRRTYLAGVIEGFREKLEAEGKKHRENGLVWVGDADLEAYYRKRHPHIRTTRTGGPARTEAHGAGRSAGRKLVLHRGISGEGATRAGGPALLPARRG